jgi:hypothetical protein
VGRAVGGAESRVAAGGRVGARRRGGKKRGDPIFSTRSGRAGGWVHGWDNADVWVPRGDRWAGRRGVSEKKIRFWQKCSPNCDFFVLHSPSTLSTSKII